MVEITASYPAGVIGTTLENLQEAAAGEHEEWSLDYPGFADVADEEGFPEIALMYRNIAIAEKNAIALLSRILKQLPYLQRKARLYGNAVTVVSSIPVKKLLRYVRHVCIRRPILR